MRYFAAPLYDPAAGAVYVDLRDAIGVLAERLAENIQWSLIPLPDREQYFVAGTRGRNAKPAYTKIFDNAREADEHHKSLGGFGYPLSERCCEKMVIHTTSPKSVETYNSEVAHWKEKHETLIARLQLGVNVVGSTGMAPIEVEWDEGDGDTGLFPGWNVHLMPPFKVVNEKVFAVEDLSHTDISELVSEAVLLCDGINSLRPEQTNKLQNLKIKASKILAALRKDTPDAGNA